MMQTLFVPLLMCLCAILLTYNTYTHGLHVAWECEELRELVISYLDFFSFQFINVVKFPKLEKNKKGKIRNDGIRKKESEK